MERSRTRFADWLPEPLTVATWMVKLLSVVSTAESDLLRTAAGRETAT
jgi:hypothetical protein